jgi:four helix bundle protein
METRTYNYEDRLVEFAGKIILFCKTLPTDRIALYYIDQILRSSGSAALHYGEAQGTFTDRDFIYKSSNTLKELKETRVSLKILENVRYGDPELRTLLLAEVKELCAISAKMILNKKGRNEKQDQGF